jgi:hypothetical protein
MSKKLMKRLNLFKAVTNSRKVTIATATTLTVLLIIDLLSTRQILYPSSDSQTILFILVVIVGYGVCSWILLEYTRRITKDLRAKSTFVNVMHWGVTAVQISLFGLLVFAISNNALNCNGYFNFCTSSLLQTNSVYLISAITASIILGIMSFKFLSWYRLNTRNFMILFYGLAAATIAIAITGDAYTKLMLVKIVQEKTPAGVASQSSFIYKTFKKYHGEVQYKVVNPYTTTLWVSPTSTNSLKNNLDQLSALPYIFMWLAIATLLRQYYRSIRGGDKKFPFKFWIVLAVPLILYLVGSNLIFSTPADTPYKFYYRSIYRAGTIGSSLLFALAFYVVTRNLTAGKVKDYLAISAIGIIMVRIALSISALEPTYGVAAHSTLLLSSYLFIIGFYALAISISQDRSLRQAIRNSALEAGMDVFGTPYMQQQIERRVVKVIKEQQETLSEQTGVETSLSDEDIKQYLNEVLVEVKKSHDGKKQN